MQYQSFLIKYAEIGTKGKNRYMFEDALIKQIRYALRDVDGHFEVTKESGRIYVKAEGKYDYEDTVEALGRVFGIADICPMVQIDDKDYENLKNHVKEYMDQVYPDKNITFKVDARRGDKQYPVTSDQINRDLGEEGLKRSVLVVATSNQSAMMRSKCTMTATTIAEYFKDQGMDVLLMMDSLTRFAMAQREVGLSIGEPPVARGYTPSIYSELPKLLERSGNFETGSITGIYTVLVEGDDANEPVSDTVRGIIDGHIMLSRKVATQNRYPAIDILSSVSRLMSDIVMPEHKEAAGKIRKLLSVYESNIDLVSIGAYKKGTNKELDDALMRIDKIYEFLQQKTDESFTLDEAVIRMIQLTE